MINGKCQAYSGMISTDLQLPTSKSRDVIHVQTLSAIYEIYEAQEVALKQPNCCNATDLAGVSPSFPAEKSWIMAKIGIHHNYHRSARSSPKKIHRSHGF